MSKGATGSTGFHQKAVEVQPHEFHACHRGVFCLNLRISPSSARVVLSSHNTELFSGPSISPSQWATYLSGKPMSGWMAGWMVSSATAIQSIYTDQFLFPYARVRKLVWYVAVSHGTLRERACQTIFVLGCIVLSILHPSLLLIQSKTSDGRGLSRSPQSQIDKCISAMLDHKWDFYQYKNWIYLFF